MYHIQREPNSKLWMVDFNRNLLGGKGMVGIWDSVKPYNTAVNDYLSFLSVIESFDHRFPDIIAMSKLFEAVYSLFREANVIVVPQVLARSKTESINYPARKKPGTTRLGSCSVIQACLLLSTFSFAQVASLSWYQAVTRGRSALDIVCSYCHLDSWSLLKPC